MAEITARGRVPLLVGGALLYFKALLEGLAEMPSADAALRAELEARAQARRLGGAACRLRADDPRSRLRVSIPMTRNELIPHP